MRDFLEKTFKSVLSAIVLVALVVISYLLFFYPSIDVQKGEMAEVEYGPKEIAGESEKIDINESNGVLYVNNEIVVYLQQSAEQEIINAVFDSLDAEIDDTMADIGIYRLILKSSMSYDELEAIIKTLKSNPIVENAFLNTVTELQSDETEPEEDIEHKDPVYPNDSWNNDEWNVSVPGGENWGVEAINAPGAWGYSDQMNSVRVGLIDTMPNRSHEDLSFENSSCLFVNEGNGKIETNKIDLPANNHGTHVSGTINAKWNNEIGVSGVMGGKGTLYYSAVYYESNGTVTDKYGTAYSYLLALKTLIDQDVQVINISLNTSRLIGFAASRGNQNAINYLSLQADLTEKGLKRIISAREAAGKPDFVICVAAGNNNHINYYKDDKATYGYRENMNTWETIKSYFGWHGECGGALAIYNNFLNLMDEEEVKNRVIVVGAVGIDKQSSTSNSTKYQYAYFSNVGSRVDVVAPGVDVYSCIVDGYSFMDGTSMATPHVTGVAGLIFACNPSLSGKEVKQILVSSTTGRYYHGDEYSGLLNANDSVVNALKTVKSTVEKVLKTEVDNGLDLCFVVDTTNSMEDDIQNTKDHMASIIEHLKAKTENYLVSLIDYRDYSERSSSSVDYPYKIQLRFTDNDKTITDAINGLDLGNGGDDKETVYSALMAAVKLDWRTDARKVIIIMGDAAPLDPEPFTDYTYDDVLLALFNADINLDYNESDERVVDSLDTSLINVYSIGTDASSDAADFFENIATSTGGSYANVDDASKVSDAVIDSIEQIKVDEKLTVNADFGESMSNSKIDIYSDGDYLFTLETDENGKLVIDSIEANTYRWTSNSIYSGGSIDIETNTKNASIKITRKYWFNPLLEWWKQNTVLIYLAFLVYLAMCFVVPITINKTVNRNRQAIANKSFRSVETAEWGNEPQSFTQIEEETCNATELKCPNCGNSIMQKARFCNQCGHDVYTSYAKNVNRYCSSCGHLCKESETYCGNCGAKIHKNK